MPQAGNRRELLLIATGGTISQGRSELGGEQRPWLSAVDLLARTAIETGRLHCLDLPYPDGVISSGAALLTLARTIERVAKEGMDGIVVTHGTDALEEVAYAMDEMLSGIVPLVFTGAMRPSWAADYDGGKNLEQAVRVAACLLPEYGTLVTLHGDIFEAWSVYKSDTVALDAFTARHGAPSGRVNEQPVELDWQPTRWNRLGRLPHTMSYSIPILTLGVGDDAALLKLVGERAERSIDGLVAASLGAGSIPPAALGPLCRLVDAGLPVVCCSSAPSGPTAATEYYPGMYTELVEAGLIIENFLSPRKARMRLMLSLGLDMPYRPFEREA
ncbi:MAG: asparaginase domain-containing protein [Desulfurellaceae bacterium]|nr:asparaginase domain-containing protein [Desulfurellaceae bacterium]